MSIDADAQEVFARILAVGIIAAGVGVYIASTVILGFLVPETIWWMIVGIGVCSGSLLMVVRGGAHGIFRGTTAATGYTTLIAFSITWHQGGIVASGANPIWGLVAPIVCGLVLGARPAMWWFAAFVVGMLALAVLPALGVKPPEPLLPDPTAVMIFNLLTFGGFAMLCLVWFIQQRKIAETLLVGERLRSDALLVNVLPEQVVDRLKAGERIADLHHSASVLFADLVGFTPLAATLDASEIVELLDDLFREFDNIVHAHGIEKIKTIGDCYMVAAGVPHPRADHATVLVSAGLAMCDAVSRRSFGGREVSLRIGVHSGSLVAGVIGDKRLLYDLWGDTVNIASRMESSGEAGRVQVSEETASFLGDKFDLEDRGLIEVKGKGELRTFFVRRAEPNSGDPADESTTG